MPNKIEDIFGTVAAIAKGMSVTFKEMMSPTVTEYYPDEPPKFEERYRGAHVLQRDANGMEKCVACFPLRCGLPGQLHLYRSCREYREGAHFGRRALRQGL